MNFHSIKIALIVGLCTIITLQAAKVIPGDSDNKATSFSFGLGLHAFSANVDLKTIAFYVGAAQAKEGNTYALARAFSTTQEFVPLTPQEVKVNGNLVANPLCGAKISQLALWGDLPVVVKNNDKNVIAMNSINDFSLLTSPVVHDAQGQNTAGILTLQTMTVGSALAAVKNHNGDLFGAPFSGIALLQVVTTQTLQRNGEQKLIKTEFKVLNADPADTTTATNKAAPFTNSSDVIKINNDVTMLNDGVDIHWNANLERFYVAVQAQAGAAAGSGARSVVVGRRENDKLIFEPITLASNIVGDDQIIATATANAIASAIKVRTLNTSTRLDYLIVLGGNGDASVVGNQVFALPIVNNNRIVASKNFPAATKAAQQGTLADVNQTPTNFYNETIFFNGSAFTKPATAASQLFTTNSVAAQVGAGPLPLTAGQQVSGLFVFSDAVFATISNDPDGTTEPGIYQSQALFDDKGRVQAWTPWVRAGGTQDKVFGANLNFFTGDFWFMTGETSSTVNTVKKTEWGFGTQTELNGVPDNASVGLIALLSRAFPADRGGIQGFVDLSRTTPGFDNLSLLIATGLDKVMFIESGRLFGGIFKATQGNFVARMGKSLDGHVPVMQSGAKVASLQGGDLSKLGPVITAAVASNATNDQHWIVLGGSKGLGIVTNSNGTGWSGDIAALSELPATMSVKRRGEYAFVLKVVADDQYLYVLTPSSLDRIEMTDHAIRTNQLNAVRLASVGMHDVISTGAFADVVVSGKFAMLATTRGLFRVGNGGDISTASSSNQVDWTSVPAPESENSIFKLYPLSSTAQEGDFAHNGQVYALNSYIGLWQGTVNRYAINVVGEIDDDTVTLVPNTFIKNTQSSFLDFSAFRDSFTTQGALLFSTNSLDVENTPLVAQLLPPAIKSGTYHAVRGSVPLPLGSVGDATIIGSVLKRSASGAQLIYGDFGLRVNE